MICYLDSCRDKVLKICTPDKFTELTESQRTAMLIESYRSGTNPDAKSQLSAFVFMGYDPAILAGQPGKRVKAWLQPTGLVMLDFDHISKAEVKSEGVNSEKSALTPYDVYDRFLKNMPKLGLTLEHDLALAHVTPSGDGLRLVVRIRQGKSVVEMQEAIGKLVGMECDKAVKDLSRLSFCPMASDILYINKSLLFAPIESKVASLRAAGDGDTADCPGTAYPVNNKDSACGTCMGNKSDVSSAQFPSTYHGVPYKDIVNKWIELKGGDPEPGDRHATLIALAMDLRKICDNDKEWMAAIMPDFGKGEEEKRDAIDWAVSQKPSMVNGTLLEALQVLGALPKETTGKKAGMNTENSSDSAKSSENMDETTAGNLPPAMPEKLPSLIQLLTKNVMPHQKAAVATMVFPALSVYTNDATFKLADNANYELSMMSVLVGKQSVGKGCIDEPIERILKRIEQQDKINRLRESEWKDRDRRRKANERGEKKPAVPIRILNSDTTNAAFLMRLVAAEEGDGERKNLTTFTSVSEIESLYKFCSTGGALNVAQTIKYAWDRKLTGADRVTSNAVCARTPLRWNFCASTTVGGAKKFFHKVLTDGVTSRIDFCTIIPPSGPFRFRYGDYTKEFNEELRPYIDNLENFRCERDEEGNAIPMTFDRILDLEEQLDQYINEVGGSEPDDTYEDYAYRAKVMAIKKLIILYIANGCKWEEAFEPFVWWAFKYGMWCKMNLFYDAASEAFKDEQINGNHGGNKSPLKEMHRSFTYADFAQKCQEQCVKQSPNAIIRKYKQRGLIVETDGKYIISSEFATKWNIPE